MMARNSISTAGSEETRYGRRPIWLSGTTRLAIADVISPSAREPVRTMPANSTIVRAVRGAPGSRAAPLRCLSCVVSEIEAIVGPWWSNARSPGARRVKDRVRRPDDHVDVAVLHRLMHRQSEQAVPGRLELGEPLALQDRVRDRPHLQRAYAVVEERGDGGAAIGREDGEVQGAGAVGELAERLERQLGQLVAQRLVIRPPARTDRVAVHARDR